MAETDWSGGYVLDVAYVHNFLAGLAPLNLALAGLLCGVRPPDVDAPFSYLDLGCGNGFTPALLAAANPHADVWGADFNPDHIRNARATAQGAGIDNATFVEASFADLLAANLPALDFVAIHGIWSWVSGENRQRIVDLLSTCVKPGGLVVLSYNCHPGWDALLPLRRLRLSAAAEGGSPVERVERALAKARRLHQAGADYFGNNAAASTALDRLEKEDRAYLAHEYLNEHWTLSHPGDVSSAVAPAGLTYVGQARIIDNFDEFWLRAEERALLDEEVDLASAQALRDLMLDRRFRRDVFVRGGVTAGEDDAAAWFANRRFALAKPRDACSLTLETRAGAFMPTPDLCAAILDALVQGAATGAALARLPTLCATQPREVHAALAVLAAMGHIQPALAEIGEGERRMATGRFNTAALASARMGEPAPALASPVTGSGVAVSAADQILLDAARFGVTFDVGSDDGTIVADQTLGALAMLGID